MPLTPEQEAEIMASMTRTPIVPDQSIGGRLAGSLGRTLQNPAGRQVIGSMLAPGIGGAIAQRFGADAGVAVAPEGAVQTKATENAPFVDTASGFAPTIARPGELKPMYVPDVNIQPAQQLSMPQIGRSMGGYRGAAGDNGIGSAQADVNTAQAAQLQSRDDATATQRRLGAAEGDQIDATADANTAEAAEKRAMAEREAKVEVDAQMSADEFFAKNQAMSDDIAKATVDRRRIFANQTTGDKVMFGLAAALSGYMSARGSGKNEFLDRVDKMMDDDVRDQMAAIDNKKGALASRQNMFGQLLQQSGDRRTASLQLRGLQLDAMKQETLATAARSGIPAAIEAANLKANELQAKRDDLNAQMKQHVLDRKRAEAAAAAAAAAAAEKESWKRQMDVFHMGLEKDKLAIEAGKTSGTTQKDLDGRVEKLGTALSSADLAKGRESLDRLLGQVEKTPKGEHIEGLGLGSKFVKGLPGGQHLVSDQANTNEQDWNALLGAYSNIRTGSGGSDAEAAKILKEAEGASTPAERANFIRKMSADFARRETALRAAAGPEASAQYDRNKAAVGAAMPGSVQVKKPDAQPANPWLRK